MIRINMHENQYKSIIIGMDRGIGSHLQSLYNNEITNSEKPKKSLVGSLISLEKIIQQRKQMINQNRLLQKEIFSQLSLEQLKKMKANKQKFEQNQEVLKLLKICQNIDINLVKYEDNISANDFDQCHRLSQRLFDLKELYLLIDQFESQINSMKAKVYEKKKTNQQKAKSLEQISTLKRKYLNKLKEKTHRAIIDLFYSELRQKKLEKCFVFFNLPRKKQKNINLQLAETPPQKSSLNLQNPQFVEFSFFVLEALFCEYSCYCLHKKIDLIIAEEHEELKVSPFKSKFFGLLWRKIDKSINYIFLRPNDSEESLYQIDEPNWLFQFLEETFHENYIVLTETILPCIRQQGKKRQQMSEISNYIQSYFLSLNLQNFFLAHVQARVETDFEILKQMVEELSVGKRKSVDFSEQREKKIKRINFIVFNLLDELYNFSNSILQKYGAEINLVQTILVNFERRADYGFDLLKINFDYEHNWIEDRIFNDFCNINYSNISNLRNVQAYNITINFIHIFEKLYNKFRKISDQGLKAKINKFYYEKLLQLVRHTSTFFSRIYDYNQHNKIGKFQILLSYKKVQDQFSDYFQKFIKQSAEFEHKINEEYYKSLYDLSVVLAAQQLNPIHRKLYRRLSDKDAFLNFQADDKKVSEVKDKWSKTFGEWHKIVLDINQLISNFQDKKVRNIFFVFLEDTEFSEDGLLFYLALFEPFLLALFGVEGTKTIKLLVGMEKGTLKQYFKSHVNSLWFLTNQQLRSIEKTKITYN